MEQIPYTINDTFQAAWWTPMTVYNGSTYVAFTSPSEHEGRHFLNVAKKDTSGKWLNHMLTRYDYVDDLGHNQTAVAVDGSGRVHVITSLHSNHWGHGGGHYFRTEIPEDITSWGNESWELPGKGDQYGYTYPIMRRHPSGDIYLIVRRRDIPANVAPMVMYVWNNGTSTWSSVGPLTYTGGPNMFIYPDDMQITPDGIVHIIFSHFQNDTSPRRHIPGYINYDPASGAFKTADGVSHSLPIIYDTPNLVYKALVANEEYHMYEPHPGVQSASLSLDAGVPSIFYRHRTLYGGLNFVRRARWSGFNTWVDELIYDSSETSAAITHNISGDNIDAFFCAQDAQGEYRLQRYRKKISTGEVTLTKMSDLRFSRLYQEGSTLYASSAVDLYQYLLSV